MNYGHLTCYNLLPTDADRSISPDILSMVHKAKDNFIYSKQMLSKLRILRFQKGSAISLFRNEYSFIMQQRPKQALILGPKSSSPQNDAPELLHGV